MNLTIDLTRDELGCLVAALANADRSVPPASLAHARPLLERINAAITPAADTYTHSLGAIRYRHDPAVKDTTEAARYVGMKVAQLRSIVKDAKAKGLDLQGLAMTGQDGRAITYLGERHPNPDLAAMPGPFWRAMQEVA